MTPVRTLIIFLILATAFVWLSPDIAIGPGRLSSSHSALVSNCWSCHELFLGATAAKCTACHKLNNIGRFATTGAPLPPSGQRNRILFHSGLADPNCRNCHIIHAGVRHVRASMTFRHDVLADSVKSDCVLCHGQQKPSDSLHRQVSQQCSACHNTSGWRPAFFEHTKYFRFDSNHRPRCDSCHKDAASYSNYTCYGCHEHTPANMAAKHAEEGIRNLDNCARCHRTGNAEESEGKSRED